MTGPPPKNPTKLDTRPSMNGASGNETATSIWTPLFDKTLTWKTDVDHEWQERSVLNEELKNDAERIPYMLMLSSTMWNDPEQSNNNDGLTWYRSVFSRQLTEAVVNHKWFHPTAYWDLVHNSSRGELSQNIIGSKKTRYYIFFDGETCGYFPPKGNLGPMSQPDLIGNRTRIRGESNGGRLRKRVRILFEGNNISNWQMVHFDCAPNGPPEDMMDEYRPDLFQLTDKQRAQLPKPVPNNNIVLLSTSARKSRMNLLLDQGLPIPPNREFQLSYSEEQNICENRKILLGFSGRIDRTLRKTLESLHNGKDVLIGEPWDIQKALMEMKKPPKQSSSSTMPSDPYYSLLSQSSFGAVPRGNDNRLGTARLVEVMSLGAIPVIYADDWMLPFHHTIDWNSIAILIPEHQAGESVEILLNTKRTAAEVCAMRKEMYGVYQKYFQSPELMMNGILEGLELANQKRRME